MSSILNDVFTVSNSNAKGAVFLLAERKPMGRENLKDKLDSMVATNIRADNIRRYAEVPFCKYGYWDRADMGGRSYYSVTGFGERIAPGVMFALQWASRKDIDLGDICSIAWNADGYNSAIESMVDVLTRGTDGAHVDTVANGNRSVVNRLQSNGLVNVCDRCVTNTEYGNDILDNLLNPLRNGNFSIDSRDVSLKELLGSLKFTIKQYVPSEERMTRILDAVRAHPGISNNGISDKIGISSTSAKSYLRSLVDAGKLRYESGNKYSAYWII